jgi:hypothetical protein
LQQLEQQLGRKPDVLGKRNRIGKQQRSAGRG